MALHSSPSAHPPIDELAERALEHIARKKQATPIAFALTGSRVRNCARPDSDYDFFAILPHDGNDLYTETVCRGAALSIKSEGKDLFERNMSKPAKRNFEQSSFAWSPYQPFLGHEYLEQVVTASRTHIVKEFICSLPAQQPIRVLPERVAEWPWILDALHYPTLMRRLQAAVAHGSNIIKDTAPKYGETLQRLGYRADDDGYYIIYNDKRAPSPRDMFVHKSYEEAKRYLRKGGELNIKNAVRGLGFVLLQVPEALLNKFYAFPQFSSQEGVLTYEGPPLQQFVDTRTAFNWSRAKVTELRQALLDDAFKRATPHPPEMYSAHGLHVRS